MELDKLEKDIKELKIIRKVNEKIITYQGYTKIKILIYYKHESSL